MNTTGMSSPGDLFFGLLSVPLVIILLVGLFFLIISMENNTTPIGYVDHSGLLSDPLPAPTPTAPDRPVR